MAQLTQIELQNLRELISSHQTASAKFRTYAQQCQDSHVKGILDQGANAADNTTQKLISFLK